MSHNVSDSLVEQLLLKAYGFLARRLDLHRGVLAVLYRHAYFLYKRLKDRALLEVARRYAAPGTLVIDVGANIGFFSWAMGRRAEIEVLAFEPDAKNFSQLEAVIAKSGLGGRVRPYRLALSDTTGAGKLYLSDLAPTDHKLINTRSTSAVDISMTTLDDFLASHPEHGRRVSLIKMDVQGAEPLVLKGMRETLVRQGCPPILIEYAPADLRAAGVAQREFFDAFAELGYRPYLLSSQAPNEPDWIIANTKAYTNLLMRA